MTPKSGTSFCSFLFIFDFFISCGEFILVIFQQPELLSQVSASHLQGTTSVKGQH
jgi:hypothetical protein